MHLLRFLVSVHLSFCLFVRLSLRWSLTHTAHCAKCMHNDTAFLVRAHSVNTDNRTKLSINFDRESRAFMIFKEINRHTIEDTIMVTNRGNNVTGISRLPDSFRRLVQFLVTYRLRKDLNCVG